jgi:hypothetical protein
MITHHSCQSVAHLQDDYAHAVNLLILDRGEVQYDWRVNSPPTADAALSS